MPWTLRMLLITFAIVLIPYIYTAWRLINALSLYYPQQIKLFRTVIPAVFVYTNLLPLIAGILYLFGTYRSLFIFSDNFSVLDILIQYPYWITLIIILETLPYFLVSDLFLLFTRWLPLSEKASWAKWIALLKLCLFAFFIFFVMIRTYIDTNKIHVSEFEIPVKNLPTTFENLNWVLTADIQIDRYTPESKVNSYIEQMDRLSPDILFFAGDLVTSGTHYIDKAVDVICQNPARLARIACIGDHDIWSDVNRISRGLKKCGWKYLDNQHHVLEYNNSKILITGVSYVYSKRISPPRLEQLLGSAPNADLKILLVHQPSKMVMNTAAKYGYDLLLAGHTHGGQIIIKPFGYPLSPTQMENNLYSGLGQIDNMKILISDGIGMSLVPIRYRVKGEISHFKLVRDRSTEIVP